MNDFSREAIRKRMREKRQRMTKVQIQNASTQMMHHLMNLPIIQQATHLAAYIANDNEIDSAGFIQAWQRLDSTHQCYLPALDPNHANQLAFVQYQPGDQLKTNRYQIPEPDINDHNIYPAELLDVVLMPLVAFDRHGARLGMGKGYYDRTFAFINATQHAKPILIGLAYEFQRVNHIITEEWDVPLDLVVTEAGYQEFRH